jgi:S1-C subfamily serine protease
MIRTLLALLFAAGLGCGARAAEPAGFDLDRALDAVVMLRAEAPADARSARTLGVEREGNGVVIDSDGLVLTIGYLILEAMAVNVVDGSGKLFAADVVAYDYDTGFGLVRAIGLKAAPMRLGDSAAAAERAPVLIAAHGGREQTLGGLVVSRREFAGYWEYLLDEAIFTAPPHPNWGGAALIGADGRLLGVGSLFVRDAGLGAQPVAGNMFVPINLLKPILGDLLAGSQPGEPRPWVGMYTAESAGRVFVADVTPEGPAARAGLRQGDLVVAVGGAAVGGQADLSRKVWAAGPAGAEVPLRVLRDGATVELKVKSISRADFMRPGRTY